ncbi:MAG: P-loop NTPase [Solirubrobacteraceae bacterium]|nr:P-loop NTPase [Solirubrobacteraceae bacterium]
MKACPDAPDHFLPENQTSGVDLRQVLSILRRQAWVILACCAIAVGAAIGLSLREEKRYTATAALLFGQPNAGQALLSLGAPPQATDHSAETNLQLVSLPVIAQNTAAALKGALSPQQVERAINLEPRGQSDVAEVSATHADGTVAATVANQFAQEYINFRRDSDQKAISATRDIVVKQIDQLRQQPNSTPKPGSAASQNPALLTPLQLQLVTLQNRAADLATLASVQTGNAQIVQTATAPSTPSSPKPKRSGLIALFGGLLVGLLLGLLREQFNRRITSPEEYAELLDVPLVGTIPMGDALGRPGPMPHRLSHAEDESFRMLHGALRLSLAGDDAKVVIVTSAVPSEGKSTVALHLAAAACSLGERVLLIDADFHRPSIHGLTHLHSGPGLPELLAGIARSTTDVVQTAAVTRDDAGQSGRQIDVLTSGTVADHPRETLNAARVADVIKRARPHYDRIVIDTAPATVVSDPIALMQRIPAVVLVVARMDVVTQEAAKRLHRQMATAGATIEGVVANCVRSGSGGGAYDYAYSPIAKNGKPAAKAAARH